MNVRLSDEPLYDEVKLVCTDRDQHPSREIAKVSRDRATRELAVSGPGQGASGRTVHRSPVLLRRDGGASGWRLPKCRTCGRAPELSSTRMAALIEGVLGSDSRSFDVSYLD